MSVGVARLCAAWLCVGLAACNPTVRGISPILVPADISRATWAKNEILRALAADNSINFVGTAGWYLVAEAGFNYIDDRCAEYFSGLFRLNRRRESIKAALSASGQTTNAILSITDVSKLTMAVVAQAFGLSSSLTDIVAGTYLYQLPPSETYEFVKKLLRAHRDGAATNRANVTDGNKAYNLIQEHLSLCLPVTIEARLVEHIAKAVAAPEAGDSGSVSVLIGSEVSRRELESAVRPHTSSTERLTAPVEHAAPLNTIGSFEPLFTTFYVAYLQNTLCVKADGRFGPDTRQAVVEFFNGLGKPRPEILSRGIQGTDIVDLDQAVREANGRDCTTRGVPNAEEVGKLQR